MRRRPRARPFRTAILVGLAAAQTLCPTPAAGIDPFLEAVHERFEARRETVEEIARSLPEPEIPVAFFLAERGRVAPERVARMRLGGSPWMDIAVELELSAEAFYVPIDFDPGPPYGHAYGYFRQRPRGKWNTIRLPDTDIVNLVNLRFVSDVTGRSPEEIVDLHSKGRGFADIVDEHRGRGPSHAGAKEPGRRGPPDEKGKGPPDDKGPPDGKGPPD